MKRYTCKAVYFGYPDECDAQVVEDNEGRIVFLFVEGGGLYCTEHRTYGEGDKVTIVRTDLVTGEVDTVVD